MWGSCDAYVGSEGLVTARGCGVAFITASNLGVPAVTAIRVDQGAILANVEGICRRDGLELPGALVEVLGSPSSTNSSLDGRFSFSSVALPPTMSFRIRAEFTDGTRTWTGVSEPAPSVDGMILDVGIIDLVEQTGLVNPGYEAGDATGHDLLGSANIVTNIDTVLPGEGLYMAMLTTGDTGVGGAVTNQSILVPDGVDSLVFDLNILTNELDQSPVFNDTVVVTLLPSMGNPEEVYRASVADMRAGSLPSMMAPEGFDGMTGFFPITIPLAGRAVPGDSLEVNVAIFNVGDLGGRTTALVDLFRWQ